MQDGLNDLAVSLQGTHSILSDLTQGKHPLEIFGVSTEFFDYLKEEAKGTKYQSAVADILRDTDSVMKEIGDIQNEARDFDSPRVKIDFEKSKPAIDKARGELGLLTMAEKWSKWNQQESSPQIGR